VKLTTHRIFHVGQIEAYMFHINIYSFAYMNKVGNRAILYWYFCITCKDRNAVKVI